jgi:hypothetical protein
MANFGKFGNLSRNGWNESTQTQTITVGQSAHIGLWGGDGDGNDLEVKAADKTICVTHEEPLPSQPHWRHFLVTGLRVGTTQINAFVAGTNGAYSSPVTVKVVGQASKRLVFFPGERVVGRALVGTIYVVGDKGEHVAAAGGLPGHTTNDRGGHTFEPTPAGHYILGPQQHVTTRSWANSVIPWGAALRLEGGEAQWKDSRGHWRVATGPKGEVTQARWEFEQRSKPPRQSFSAIVEEIRDNFLSSDRGSLLSTTYKLNDFGVWGWNLRLNGHATGFYIHTTPQNEQQTEDGDTVVLLNSHGCIHIAPSDREFLMGEGMLKAGVPFEVRRYDEKGPP